jgi:hypothetical protein
LLVDRKNPSKLKLNRFDTSFDIKNIEKLSDSGYLIKQQLFVEKGIRKLKIFETVQQKENDVSVISNYLFMATYAERKEEINPDLYQHMP